MSYIYIYIYLYICACVYIYTHTYMYGFKALVSKCFIRSALTPLLSSLHPKDQHQLHNYFVVAVLNMHAYVHMEVFKIRQTVRQKSVLSRDCQNVQRKNDAGKVREMPEQVRGTRWDSWKLRSENVCSWNTRLRTIHELSSKTFAQEIPF